VSVVRVLESLWCIIFSSDFEDVRHWCSCFGYSGVVRYRLWFVSFFVFFVCFFVSLFLGRAPLGNTFIKTSLEPEGTLNGQFNYSVHAHRVICFIDIVEYSFAFSGFLKLGSRFRLIGSLIGSQSTIVIVNPLWAPSTIHMNPKKKKKKKIGNALE
jgi:hypothetical protein